jgi:hypothetical protein
VFACKSYGLEERIALDHAAQLFLLPALFARQSFEQTIVLLLSDFLRLHFKNFKVQVNVMFPAPCPGCKSGLPCRLARVPSETSGTGGPLPAATPRSR